MRLNAPGCPRTLAARAPDRSRQARPCHGNGLIRRCGRSEGGYAVLELPDRQAVHEWAAKFSAARRCEQEVRAFMYDPES